MTLIIGITIGIGALSDMGAGGNSLAVPAAPAFTVEPGLDAGEIEITVSAEPADWGDLTTAGDGLGIEGLLQWWNEVDGWQVLVDPSALGVFPQTLDESLWGTDAVIEVRGVSDAGRFGASNNTIVSVPAASTAASLLLETGDHLLMESGDRFLLEV